MGLILTLDQTGKLDILDIKERIDRGCQVEFTRLLIDQNEWCTFGLEWFGDKTIEIGEELMNEVLNEKKLVTIDAIGYNAF